MKLGNFNVLDVSIFNEDGKLVTELNTLKNSKVLVRQGRGYLHIVDALLDQKLLEFIGSTEEDKASDFEKHLNMQKFSKTITFNENLNGQCKVVGKGLMRNADDMKDVEYLFEIPNAEFGGNIDFDGDIDDLSKYDLVFKINPFNEQGDLFKMHI